MPLCEAAEPVEGRGGAKGNVGQQHRYRTQSRDSLPRGLTDVGEAAIGDGKLKFTALPHHVDVDSLRASYLALKRHAAPGVDGMTWREYGQDLEQRLPNLHARLHRGGYRALPSRRQFIAKPDGSARAPGAIQTMRIGLLHTSK